MRAHADIIRVRMIAAREGGSHQCLEAVDSGLSPSPHDHLRALVCKQVAVGSEHMPDVPPLPALATPRGPA
jgi:hypothetical protein